MAYNFENKPKAEKRKSITLHYVGKLDNGVEFDNSHQRGEPITFVIGAGQMISGFEEEVATLSEGEKKQFTLTPDRAYGESKENLFQAFEKKDFPEDFELETGKRITVNAANGQVVPAVISEITDTNVVLNFNHPFAGRNLNFEVEVLKIEQTGD